ncbi:unnamed protein product (macronuclear) [Paramecium tetraurelia]|uniref:Uncharacterized protein n=1 Tax=Paramecium tetraurelia TaxID=5888 RepID=A0E863_PARTE|nr:uncharacterized protein GSPATT00024208001 [Paramecium tetraurelia]CAK91480.1 unnamed protein product [Paramecium tetraurelia]|eukprot:XP_001458877.1 hypothetical protein (macronuclear) [Paramecium tetraurelia strain d4-2]
MLSISKQKQYPNIQDRLSGMLITKNAPIRNYSTCKTIINTTSATRHSRISYQSKQKYSQNKSEVKGISSRTFSVNEVTELPQISKPTKIIIKRPNFIPRPKQQFRKLMHVQTSPSNLESERKQSNSNCLQFETINLNIEAEDVYILYKGFRNLNQFNKICILSYNLLFGEYNSHYFINPLQNPQIKPQNNKQLIMKIRTESILILQLNPNQKLNSLHNTQIDWFDCIYSTRNYHSKETLSSALNRNNLWVNISKIPNLFKVQNKIMNYYYVDVIYSDPSNIYEIDNYINKILLIDDENTRLFHLFINAPADLQIVYQRLQEIFRNNQTQDLQKVNLKEMIEKSNLDMQLIQTRIKQLKYLNDQKIKSKQHFKKQHLSVCPVSPEERAEKMRNEIVEYIKSNSKIKIANMHFVVGDTIMRNIEMFRNHENDKFYRHQETVQLIDHFMKNSLPNFQNNINKANYAFYCL